MNNKEFVVVNNKEEILDFLESKLGHAESKGKNNYQYKCPFCHHPKNKLSIKVPDGFWQCWVCEEKGNSIYSLLTKIGISSNEIPKFISKINRTDDSHDHGNRFTSLPEEYVPLDSKKASGAYSDLAKSYLSSRKISNLDIKRYRIGYCNGGRLSGHLIFPNFGSRGETNYYTTRSFLKSSQPFINPPVDKQEIIGNELFINWSMPIIICESFLDSVTIGSNSIPLFGKSMGRKLISKIIENNVERVYVCLDGDAIKSGIRIIEYLSGLGIEVFLVKLPYGEDANSLGRSKVWEYILESKKYNAHDIFEEKINEMLSRV